MASKTSALYLLKGMNDDGSGNEKRGIRLDKAHTNICDMSHTAFGQWCTENAAWHYDTFSYLKQESAILVDANMYDLATASYMFIDNFQYFPKTFYAFVEGFEYVNDGCCKIKFSIDYVRTFWHLVRFKECFVEREHPVNDTIGANTITENIETTENWQVTAQAYEDFSELNYATFYTKGGDANPADYQRVNGQLIGIPVLMTGDVNTVQFIVDMVNQGYEERLKQIYSYPTSNVTGMQLAMSTSLDGYTPRYNKCYTSQFNKCVLTDMQGTGQELYFEYSDGNGIGIYINKNIVPSPTIQAIPVNYLGLERDYTRSITLDNFPETIFSGNSYAQYKANYAVANMLSYQSQVAKQMNNTMRGIVLGSVDQSAMGLFNVLNTEQQYQNQENVARIQASNNYGQKEVSNTLIDLKACGIYLLQMCQPYEYIKRIDDFFYKFGYQTNQLKQPNISSNATFNYVKTRDCAVYGDCPAQAITDIQNAFNRGVTIWHNIESMLDY